MNAYSLGILLGSATLLVGCNDSDTDHAQSQVRVTHASANAPMVKVKLNGKTVNGLDKVDYQVGSGLITLNSGAYNVSVDALLTGDASTEVIGANLNFAPDMQYDIIALNYTANIEPVVLARDTMMLPSSNQVRLDVLHAHPDISGVDIYLTTEADISAQSPAISNLEFKMDSADLPVTLPSGTYRIRITLNGDKGVAFDSGDLELAGGSDLMVTAVPNVSGGAVSPVNLLVADGNAVNVLRSTAEKASVRVVHAVDDAPAVDVLASGSAVSGLTNIMFKEFRRLDLASGVYDLSVAASSDNSLVVIEAPNTELMAGSETSIYAVGKLNAITDSTIEPLVINESLRSVSTYAKLRVIHASPTAGDLGLVDIHASSDGVFNESTAVIKGVDFKENATLNVPEGMYYLAVILANDATFTPAVSAMATVDNGGVYSIVATDDFAGGLVLNIDNMAP